MAEQIYSHGRPLETAFYEKLRRRVSGRPAAGVRHAVAPDSGTIVNAKAGSLVTFELPQGPQIVNVFFWNAVDPDERYWAEETMLIEGAYLQPYSRLWGTMARFRPLVTMIEDTVITLRRPGEPQSFHHFAHGGSGTPSDWRLRGGRPGVASTWERLVAAMRTVDVPARNLTENVSLFQKTAIDPVSQTLAILPSDALPGDRVVWFAEIDLTFAVAASPYGGGGIAIAELDGSTRSVNVIVEAGVASPLGWPYPGMAYPDLSLYVDAATGARARDVRATPGIGAQA